MRVERLWRAEGRQVPPGTVEIQRAEGSGRYDFVSDHTIDGGQLWILNVIDECTREALGGYPSR